MADAVFDWQIDVGELDETEYINEPEEVEEEQHEDETVYDYEDPDEEDEE